MTERLYYRDSYTVKFKARVLERTSVDGLPGVVLDRTYFYPTSGGQRHDTGLINGIQVSDVYPSGGDDSVIHVLAEEVAANQVEGIVDWPRRFDHMQQHSGQHILSQAFVRITGAQTVSFHLGDESSTLDLDTEHLAAEQMGQVERLANEIVWENRPVNVRFVAADEAKDLPLRKLPESKDGMYRLVEIDSFDVSACGGTHVSRTGEVGLIKVVKVERLRGNTRVEFLCGGRSLADYNHKHQVLQNLSNEMTTGYWELENSVARIRQDLKQANHALKQKTNQLIQLEAENLANKGRQCGEVTIIREVFSERDPGELRRLASQLVAHGKVVVLIGLAGQKAQLIFTRSDNVPVPLDAILKDVLPVLGAATGGGSVKFAQGGGPPAGQQQVDKALMAAEDAVCRLILNVDDDGFVR